jgi:hypothetical protein
LAGTWDRIEEAKQDSTWTAPPSTPAEAPKQRSTYRIAPPSSTPRQTAPARTSATPKHCSTSMPDSNLQHSAAPAAPMDSSSARLAGAAFLHACHSQAAGQQQLKGLGVKI